MTGDASALGIADRLSDQQIAFFQTFGFLKIPGLFASEFDRISAAFDRVFIDDAADIFENHSELHDHEQRLIMMKIIDRSPDLVWLRDDPRVRAIFDSLLPPGYEFADSDGSVFNCETSWHADTFGAPMHKLHVKLSLYLDPLRAETGAIRLIPGTNHHTSTFAKLMRNNLGEGVDIESVYGISEKDIPAWSLESEPGDAVVWNFRTVHASYYGGTNRRLMSLSFREPLEDSPPPDAGPSS